MPRPAPCSPQSAFTVSTCCSTHFSFTRELVHLTITPSTPRMSIVACPVWTGCNTINNRMKAFEDCLAQMDMHHCCSLVTNCFKTLSYSDERSSALVLVKGFVLFDVDVEHRFSYACLAFLFLFWTQPGG